MTLTKDIASKLAVAFVAVAMIFSAFAPSANAQTTEELQQMINDLLAQVAGLQGQLGQDGGSMSSSDVCPYTWTRDLSSGSTGMDVMKLQQFLNSNADTRVAAEGAGSAGMETEYYGPATAAAVSKFQVAHRSEILSPANLVNPTGYFGPSSRAKANSLCVSAPVVDDSDDMDDSDDSSDDDDDMGGLSGEGEIVTFEIDDDEDTVTEGDEDVSVMILTLEAEDGDVELSRMDFTLVADTGVANEEDEPWDVFEEVSLWVDGDKVASFEADDEDEYLDEDTGEFRFTNLGIILMEDEEVEINVAVSVANSVDGADVANAADWNIEPTEVRYFDADGVATTDSTIDEMTAGDDSEHFDIEERGTDDDADIEASSDNPDASTLLVDEDSADSDEFLVHLFDIEVDDESGDLELGDAHATVTITNANPAAAIAGGQEDVIDSIYMTIDGVKVKGEAVAGATSGGDDEDTAIALNGGSTDVQYLFEFDADVVLESDTDYEAEISIEFKGQDGNYVNGVTVETAVNGANWEAEGAEDDDNISGTDSSETHTLATVVPVISGLEVSTSKTEDDNAGTVSFEFNVEADGENDVTLSFGDVGAVSTTSADDVRFTLSGTDLTIATAAITKVSGDATVNGTTGWTIADGDDATFVLDVTFTTVNAGDNGTYRVTLDTIEGVEIDETSDGIALVF